MSTSKHSMRLITSSWLSQKTFRMIPVSLDAPYSEVIFDPETKTMVLFSKVTKTTFHMLPKLDDNGDLLKVTGKPRPAAPGQTPRDYREGRNQMETFMEFYITEKEEMNSIIELLCDNASDFDYKKYTEASSILEGAPEGPKIELLKS